MFGQTVFITAKYEDESVFTEPTSATRLISHVDSSEMFLLVNSGWQTNQKTMHYCHRLDRSVTAGLSQFVSLKKYSDLSLFTLFGRSLRLNCPQPKTLNIFTTEKRFDSKAMLRYVLRYAMLRY